MQTYGFRPAHTDTGLKKDEQENRKRGCENGKDIGGLKKKDSERMHCSKLAVFTNTCSGCMSGTASWQMQLQGNQLIELGKY